MTTTAPLVSPSPHGRASLGSPADRVLLRNVSWNYYLRTIEEFMETSVRVNYLDGEMEIFMPGVKHERIKKAIARLLETYSLAKRKRIDGLGSVTCHREGLAAGLEPDECFYIATPLPPITPHPLDLAVHSPPDLAIEVDVFNSSVSRESIYAQLGIPEIWKYDGKRVWPNIRQTDGSYRRSETSSQLPELSMQDFSRFVNMALENSPSDAAIAWEAFVKSDTGR